MLFKKFFLMTKYEEEKKDLVWSGFFFVSHIGKVLSAGFPSILVSENLYYWNCCVWGCSYITKFCLECLTFFLNLIPTLIKQLTTFRDSLCALHSFHTLYCSLPKQGGLKDLFGLHNNLPLSGDCGATEGPLAPLDLGILRFTTARVQENLRPCQYFTWGLGFR